MNNDNSGFGRDDPNRGPMDRAANAMDGRDDPNRGPLDRAENSLTGRDDPNRGPLDRAANAITGGTGGVSAAMGHDDPNRGPLDRAANAVTGNDDPNRGPLDRAANATTGHDDPNRGPLDRAANAITGGTGGVSGAMGHDDPNRGPLDRTANALNGDNGSVGTMDRGHGAPVSAMFDSQAEAERAVAELRSAGVNDSDLSVIARSGGTTTTRDADGLVTDEHHENIARGILGGGALGAGLGVLALAIPGVGPLVAAGAIAASAVPGAMAIGAAAGAAAGTLNESLKEHGIADEDVSYYNDRLSGGGVLVTVGGGADPARVGEILRRNGGHNQSSARTPAM